VASRRSTVKRKVGPALYQVMEPGDQIIAGTLAMSGIGPWLEMLFLPLAILILALSLAVFSDGATPVWSGMAALLTLVRLATRRPVFVAVTQRQLICYRMSWNYEPVRLSFCAPLPTVRVTSLRRPAPRWRTVRYDGPGADKGSLRLNVFGGWRPDLDEVLAALQAAGARVTVSPS
jgi:hypothetical protein